MKWLQEIKLDRKIKQLTKYERNLFRVKNRYSTKVELLRHRIFQEYLNQGKMPPKRLYHELRLYRRFEGIAANWYERIRSAREHFKEKSRDLKRGIDMSIDVPDSILKILQEVDNSSIEQLERVADLSEQEQYDLSLIKQIEKEFEEREKQIEFIVKDDMEEILEDWQSQLLADLSTLYPEEFEKVPESVKKKAEEAKKELEKKEREREENE